MAVSVDDPKALGAFMPNRADLRQAERDTKALRKSPHRRRNFLSRVRAHDSIVRAGIATLEALLAHSDDTAKPAWPGQRRLAEAAHVSERTVRRHIAELRDAGFLLVFTAVPVRDPATGRWWRKRTNRYYFIAVSEPREGRRVRRKPRSHLEDRDGLSNPLRIRNPRPHGRGGGSPSLVRDKSSDETACIDCDSTGWLLDESDIATRCPCSSGI